MKYICPNCGKKLNKDSARLLCEGGHSFDRAAAGYYNLLLSTGGIHGDNREMVAARRVFLSRGYYRPLADALASAVLENTPALGSVLDSGSGEGYYTGIVEQALTDRDGESVVYAFDISKDAVKAAAKKNGRINYSVASAYRQPFADGSFDTVYNVFSPLALAEVSRVLKAGGVFVMVIPDEYHLFELKAEIYDTPYKNKVEDTHIKGYELLSDMPLEYDMRLECAEDIASLFGMTPYAYRTKKEDRDRVYALKSLNVKAAFRILIYRKDG